MADYGSPILVDEEALVNATKGYDKLAQSLDGDKQSLEEKDDNLKNAWFGTAGDDFYLAYYTIEKKMKNLITRCNNASTALDETSTNFNSTDKDAAGKLNIEQQTSGSQSSGH